ncbi:peroxidase 17-like precursor [Gossypium hirsutum]|uniref:Peroxidase n=1 Tax=Gossypium hirsutum TaxID=3635 RepID=Q8RVP6_GOSHI|nr:peroxidase 17-like precursor [Gossypium hirsutum]AAL93152.1 gaiacol peroxidase [Gossypium hirsutum]
MYRFPWVLLLVAAVNMAVAAEPLRPGFYSETCPPAEFIVRDVMKKAMIREPRSLASVMRLQFHDCFVNGCDGSLLLDDTADMVGEKQALSNINSLRSFEVVDEIKEALEDACPSTVSCADILVLAARDAVALSGGPNWEVRLGRKDSLTASQQDSDNIMPSPRADATSLINLFAQFNLSVKDLVALSGSHSIGKARCFSIMFRLYNQSGSGKPDPAIEPEFREKLNQLCPLGVDENVTGPLDATPRVFDNQFFKDLVGGRGFLNSDQTLFTSRRTRPYVRVFSKDQDEFFKAFVEGMLKMGELQVEQPGEIRINCRVVNGRPVDVLMSY